MGLNSQPTQERPAVSAPAAPSSAPVVIRAHDVSSQLVYLDTPPELAKAMGRFQLARYVGKRGAPYLLAEANLEAFRHFAAHQGWQLHDERNQASASRPYGRERPLPECEHCGQPAQLGARLAYCPGCGKPWAPIQVDAYRTAEVLSVSCHVCRVTQPAGMAYCKSCGAKLPAFTPTRSTQARRHLQEPLPLAAGFPAVAKQLEPAHTNAVAAQGDSDGR